MKKLDLFLLVLYILNIVFAATNLNFSAVAGWACALLLLIPRFKEKS